MLEEQPFATVDAASLLVATAPVNPGAAPVPEVRIFPPCPESLSYEQSDTPGEAGGLMSVTAPRADVLTGGFSLSL
jgi:hypothetical protein